MKLLVFAALITVSAAARLEHLERKYLPPYQSSGQSSYHNFGSNTYGYNSGNYGSNSYGSTSVKPGTYGTTGASSGAFGASGASQTNYDVIYPGVKNAYLPPKYESPITSSSAQYAGSVQGLGTQNAFSQQYGQQGAVNQQYGQQGSVNQQYGQQGAVNQQYSQQAGQQAVLNQQYGQQTGLSQQNGQQTSFSQQYGQQNGISQQYSQQTGLKQQYGQQTGISQFDYQAATQSTNRFSVQSKYQSQPSAVNRQYLAPYSSYSSQDIPQQAFDEKTGYYY